MFREFLSTINQRVSVNETRFGCQGFPSVTQICSMIHNHALADNTTYIPSCTECIDIVSNLHRIFEFGNDIMCPNGIDISRLYKFGLNYVHESSNDSTGRVHNSDSYPIECIQFKDRVQCLKPHYRNWVSSNNIKFINELNYNENLHLPSFRC